jgi:hypothetical protein
LKGLGTGADGGCGRGIHDGFSIEGGGVAYRQA